MAFLWDNTREFINTYNRWRNTIVELPRRAARNPNRTLSRDLCPRLSKWALLGLGIVVVVGVVLGVSTGALERTTSWFGHE